MAPLKKGMLSIVLRTIQCKFESQPYLSTLYHTIFSTMYHGLLRISEVADGVHSLKAKDVQIGGKKNKFLLVFRTSKMHWKNMKPQLIKISSTKMKGGGAKPSKNNASNSNIVNRSDSLPCPFVLLRSYAQLCGGYHEDSEPFFVFSDKSPILAAHISACLKTVLKESGFQHQLYSSHSLRIGRTVDLFNLGLSVETIKKLGQWRSNAVYR